MPLHAASYYGHVGIVYMLLHACWCKPQCYKPGDYMSCLPFSYKINFYFCAHAGLVKLTVTTI